MAKTRKNNPLYILISVGGLVLLLVLGLLIAYSQTGFRDNQANAFIESIVTTQLGGYLENPGIGWQYMNSSDTSILPETVAYPDRSEVSWRMLHTGHGTFDLSALEDARMAAVAEGKQFSFRVYTMRGEGFGGHQMPDWVANTGIPLVGSGSGESGQPDYSNCTYQQHWGDMVEALRQRYDGDSDIAYIDISGYGNFNEWSWHDGVTEFDTDPANPSTLDGHARKRLIDMFIGGSSSSHQCRNNSGQIQTISYNYPGFAQSQLIMPWAGIRHSVKYAYDKSENVGFRHDCLGRSSLSDFGQPEIQEAFGNRWRTAPIVYELCAIDWEDSGFTQNVQDVLDFSHPSLVHDNPNDTPEPAQTIRDLMQPLGYRYTLFDGSYDNLGTSGDSIPVSLEWMNIGLAPSYPRMGQDFAAYAGLRDSSGTIVAQVLLDEDVHLWMPADPTGSTTPIISTDVQLPLGPPGDFDLVVWIDDPRTGLNIGLDMVAGDTNNTYKIGDITVLPVSSQTPTNTPTDTPVLTDTPTNTPTATPTLTPTATLTGTPVSTPIITTSSAPTQTSTPTPTPTATNTLTPTPTFTPTNTPSPTNTPTPTSTFTPTPTQTPTPSSSNAQGTPVVTSTPVQTTEPTPTNIKTDPGSPTPTTSPQVTTQPTITPSVTMQVDQPQTEPDSITDSDGGLGIDLPGAEVILLMGCCCLIWIILVIMLLVMFLKRQQNKSSQIGSTN